MAQNIRNGRITFAVMLLIMAALLAIGIRNDGADDSRLKAAFEECSKDEGDAGCDSCYFKIYGKHINPFENN